MRRAKPDWAEELPLAVTVCDRRGVCLYMNAKSAWTFRDYGGRKLLGTDLLGCHPEPAKTKMKALLRSGKTNAYTIEKKGLKKLIYQAPWFRKGRRMGIVELSIELPKKLPHFVRKP